MRSENASSEYLRGQLFKKFFPAIFLPKFIVNPRSMVYNYCNNAKHNREGTHVDGYRLIDTGSWRRYEHFRHFFDEAPCSISLCDEIDVTSLRDACREKKISFYIAMLYAVTSVVNSREEFMLTAIDSRETEYLMPAVWERVDVVHNVFHEDSETYTGTFTVWDPDFYTFFRNCSDDIGRAKNLRIMSIPCGDNVFEASCVPWRHFTSVGVVTEPIGLSPIVAWGGLREVGGKTFMPLSIQIHHAAADGYHLARFLNETEERASDLARYINAVKSI